MGKYYYREARAICLLLGRFNMFNLFAKVFRGGSQEGVSYIGSETVVSGDVKTQTSLIIAGKVDGNVTSPILKLEESGAIVGSVTGEEVHLSGLVRGDVFAERIRLEATARLTGDATYSRISVADGAKVQGKMIQKGSGSTVSTLQATPSGRQNVEPGAAAAHLVLPLSRGNSAA